MISLVRSGLIWPVVSANQVESDTRLLTERILENILFNNVSERQMWKYSNKDDCIQQGYASITEKTGMKLFNNRGLKGKGLLSSFCDF